MSKRHDSPTERLLLRQRLCLTVGDLQRQCRWQWVSVSILTLVYASLSDGSGFGALVSAKPRPQSAIVTSRANPLPAKDRISPPPVDAVLANVRLKPPSQARVQRTVAATGSRSSRAVDNNRDRSLRGISHLIDPARNTNLAPINRLIGR